MDKPTYDELLQYSHALETTLGALLQASLTCCDIRHDIQLVQTVDKAMTLAIRSQMSDDYEAQVAAEIQRLHSHIPGIVR